jgi:hypothetical protein
MEFDVVNFGIHKGLLVSEVPVEYLAWAVKTLKRPQGCLLPELERRSCLHGTRDSLTALEALSSIKCRTRRKKRYKGKWKTKLGNPRSGDKSRWKGH